MSNCEISQSFWRSFASRNRRQGLYSSEILQEIWERRGKAAKMSLHLILMHWNLKHEPMPSRMA